MWYTVYIPKRYTTHKEEHTMFKSRKSTTYKVTYKFIDEDEVFTTTATAAGLTNLSIDWAIEVLDAQEL